MSEQAQQTIPIETLLQKIGTLTLQNDFLSNEVQRVSRLYLGLKGELVAEIGRVEADVEKEEESVKSVVKSVIARVKAKF